MPQTIFFVHVCLFGAGLYFVKQLLGSRHSTPLPPGPIGWPIIGSLFLFPGKPWEYFAALGKKYGSVSSIRILGTDYVILNSSEAISGVLESQSNKCSNRPHLTMASDLVGIPRNVSMLFMDDNARLRQYRKLMSRAFGSRNGTAIFNSIEEEETHRFLRSVLQRPENLADHIRIAVSSVLLKVIYGYTVREAKDLLVDVGHKVMSMVSLVGTPSEFLVDVIPTLRYLPKWLPGMAFLENANEYNQFLVDSILTHKYVLTQMAAGTAIPSFSSSLLAGGVTPEEGNMIKWTSVNAYLAGSDTTVSAIHSFFLAMVLFPDVQAKAQAEVDAVIGYDRLPSFSDLDALPYVNALCKEVLRWHVLTPLAMPHVASEDIYYSGFLIPKGSRIIGNVWAVLHNESTYPDPGAFRPERFLGEIPQPHPQKVCFGFGRRICPGYHLAESALFISVATSLAVLNISKEVVDGVQITPKVEVTTGLISHPKPFRCQITARSPTAVALLLD